jgi:hypothetical protein
MHLETVEIISDICSLPSLYSAHMLESFTMITTRFGRTRGQKKNALLTSRKKVKKSVCHVPGKIWQKSKYIARESYSIQTRACSSYGSEIKVTLARYGCKPNTYLVHEDTICGLQNIFLYLKYNTQAL